MAISFVIYDFSAKASKKTETRETSIPIENVGGLYALIAWLPNSTNDVYILLFHSDTYLIAAVLELWTKIASYLMLAIFLTIFDSISAGAFMH